MAYHNNPTQKTSRRGLLATGLLLAGGFGLWQFWPVQAVQPKLVQSQEVSKTFYRLKATYTYTGKNGAEPLEFDVVAGCALQLTQYITGDVSGMSSRVPTMVAYEMSDGGAIGIAIPKACRGSTTSNVKVPSDFLPATIEYEDAKDLSLGMLYLSEEPMTAHWPSSRFMVQVSKGLQNGSLRISLPATDFRRRSYSMKGEYRYRQ